MRALAPTLFLATLVAVIAPPRVLAQSAVQARFFDESARAAYARGDYEAALADFFELARVSPSQGTLYNIALSAELAHRDALAFDALERYLAGAPDDPERMADARTRMHAMAARLALLRVTSSHEGATIWVDRRELGAAGVAPDTIVLSPGAHVIALSHPGAHDAEVEVVAEVGVVHEVHLDMTPRLGRLRVALEGSASAEIVAVSDATGARHGCDLDAETALPIGGYHVTVSRDGYAEESFVVQVQEDALESRVVTLRALARPTGALAVRANVAALVRIDGVERAETPARVPSLEVGTHRVEITAPGHVAWSGEIEVTEGRVSYLSVSLVPTP